jgi:uncharacterized protein YutE (UPF0331/DUF86 family)
MEENKLFSWIDSKVIYSLSLLLIIFTIRDSIVSLFSEGISLRLFWIDISPGQFIDGIILILFSSVYIYGINYMIQDPLNKLKRYFNHIASALWFISFFSPFYIIIILFLESVLVEGIILTIISLLFAGAGILASILSEKQMREMDSMELEEEIEKLKLEPTNKNNVAEFLRYYLILDSLVKNALVEKMKISIDEDEPINLSEAIKRLFRNNFIKSKTREKFQKLGELRNKLVHGEYNISEKEIEQIKEAIKEFEEDIKEGKNK